MVESNISKQFNIKIKKLCYMLGINKEELVKKPLNEFKDIGVSLDAQLVMYEKHETNRKEKIKFLQKMLKDKEMLNNSNLEFDEEKYKKKRRNNKKNHNGSLDAHASLHSPLSIYARRIQGIT